MRVGYVGIGNMGGPMAANLARAGNEVIIGDLNQAAVDAFTGEHETARPANGLAVVGQDAEAVFTCLPNGKIVAEAVLGEGGIEEGMAEGSVLVDMSSSAPMGTIALGEALAERGIRMVDAPVSGGVPRAIAGTIAIMVGGAKEDIEKVRLALETRAADFETSGLGSAHAMKSINNVLSATNLLVGIEALVVGKKFGLDPQNMVDILNYSGGKNSDGKQAQGVRVKPRIQFGLLDDLMIKDVATAWRTRWVCPGLSAAQSTMYQAARNHMIDNADNSDIARWIEANGGIGLSEDASSQGPPWTERRRACRSCPEDLEDGHEQWGGEIVVDREEILAKYDPWPFLTDDEAAKASIFGSLVASDLPSIFVRWPSTVERRDDGRDLGADGGIVERLRAWREPRDAVALCNRVTTDVSSPVAILSAVKLSSRTPEIRQ